MTVSTASKVAEDIGKVVEQGLSAPQKTLPFWLLYDAEGSKLFDLITTLPEYTLYRQELEILNTFAPQIAGRFSGRAVKVIDLGPGNGMKAKILLEELIKIRGMDWYVPIDVCQQALDIATERISSDPKFSMLVIRLVRAEYLQGLKLAGGFSGRKLVLFLGSSIGNYGLIESMNFLKEVRSYLQSGDYLLLGLDLEKTPEELEAAYNDSAGVTARFTKNILTRINRELDGNFVLEKFEHNARYVPALRIVLVGLRSLADQTVRVGKLGREFNFATGELLHLETCQKYNLEHIQGFAEACGYKLVLTCTDPDFGFADTLWQVP